MIFETLTLRNFGLFRGEQVLHLAPGQSNGKKKPIILIGGINGGGKTTLLDAVQLALYGSRGRYSKRSNVHYDEFLRDSINNGVKASEGASVGLTMRITSEGCEHLYEIRRAWSQRGRTLRERVHVFKDGIPDQFLVEHWADLVEEVIPLGISQLFFFDAEKIRFLADDETGNGSLGSAIKALLGLDLAERLINDAGVLEGRLTAQVATEAQQSDNTELTEALDVIEKDLRTKKAERASLENHRLRAENEMNRANDVFAAVGGTHWENRESHRQKLAKLRGKETELTSDLVRLAAGSLPLCLVDNILGRVEQQDTTEVECREQTVLQKLLTSRDRQILTALRKQAIDDGAIEAVRKLQKADRDARRKASRSDSRLLLSDSARTRLSHLQAEGLRHHLDEAKRLLTELDKIRRLVESTQQAVEAIPEKSDIAEVMQELQKATKELAVLDDRARRLTSEIDSVQAKRDDIARKLQKLRRAQTEMGIQNEEGIRMAKLAVRTQQTMQKFLRRATADKIDHLSARITESFRFLLRKKTLVRQVHIDPTTFSITLCDNAGQTVPKHRLSEGEKQVFAISVLWGLAQASPRPLPSIIDTPMARLDSEHRQHLVDRYFPNASHQVIILSTDTEVDQKFYRGLQRHVSRAYHLDYDETDKSTVAAEGYFWRSK